MIKLWMRDRVVVVDESSVPYQLLFEKGILAAPVLDTYIAQYEHVYGESFSFADRLPMRVGIILPLEDRMGDTHELQCVRVSWAQSHIRSRVAADMLPKREQFYRLAVDCLLKTVDDRYILAKRSQKVSEYKSHWDVSAAGWVNLDQALATGKLEDQILRELTEECGVEAKDVVTIDQLGLCLNPFPEYSMAEVCYLVHTSLSSDEVLSLAARAPDSWEGKHFGYTGDNLRFIFGRNVFKPAAAATIMLACGFPFSDPSRERDIIT